MLDADNGNTNWKYSELLKLKQIYNSNPFESLGTISKARTSPGHTKIQLYLI